MRPFIYQAHETQELSGNDDDGMKGDARHGNVSDMERNGYAA